MPILIYKELIWREGPEADSGHFLVGINMKQEVPRERNRRKEHTRIRLRNYKERMDYRQR